MSKTVPAQPDLARGLIVLVFFLARLTGDPTNLYLPLDALLQARAEFAKKHGFNDPLTLQFGRFLGGLARFDRGYEAFRRATAFDGTCRRVIL
jgi:peptide/nickel transport system permease protein